MFCLGVAAPVAAGAGPSTAVQALLARTRAAKAAELAAEPQTVSEQAPATQEASE